MKIMSSTLRSLIDKQCLIIASTSIGAGLLGTVVGFYYIKIFLTIYHLDNKWLNIVQVLFAIWNAVNDPLFGCVQDVGFARCPRWLLNRRKVILYMGPIYALSFVLFWIPWSKSGHPSWLVGLQLLLALFLYDSMLSLVLSAHCGLFTEYTTQHHARIKIVVYMEIAGLLAGFVILPLDAISKSLSDFRSFQVCTAVIALLAAGFFLITGLFASDEIAQSATNVDAVKISASNSMKDGRSAAKAILINRDFWCVVLGNFFHIMRMTGDQNFLAILTESLLSPNGILTLGSIQISLFYAGCSVFSNAFLVLCWPLLHHFGAFVCLMGTLALSAVNCIATAIVGRTYYSWLALFLLFENILSKGLWPAVYNVFFPDIIDEDMARHKRKFPLSTMVFTMNALFTKPAISLAPIIIVAILNNSGYREYLQLKSSLSSCNGTVTSVNAPSGNCAFRSQFRNGTELSLSTTHHEISEPLYSTMFYISCLFPLACVILEAACFVPYSLKFRHRQSERIAVANTDETIL